MVLQLKHSNFIIVSEKNCHLTIGVACYIVGKQTVNEILETENTTQILRVSLV